MKNECEHVILQDIQSNIDNLLPSLKVKKQQMHLTNQDIADHTGVSADTVRKYFAGESKNPNVFNIMSFCIYLGVSLDELLGNNSATHVIMQPPEIRFVDNPEDKDKIRELETENKLLKSDLSHDRELLDTKNHIIKQLDIGLMTSFALWLASVLIYIGIDVGNKDIGLIKHDGISPFLFLILVALLVGIYFLVSMIIRILKRKKYSKP